MLPAAHYIDDALGTGARTLGASVALAAPGVATDKPRPTPPLHRLVHRDRVTVEEDGNGVQAARFATTVAGKDVRYALLIENGCASSDPARPCPAPVRGLTVTLNDDVVFQNDDAFTKARSEITLNPAGTQLNSLVLAARGAPGSAARVRIIAIGQPDKPRPTPPLHRLVHRDRVAVEEDGNGVQAARFATTVAGKDVRYALLIENGCASSDPARPCPAPVRGLTVTLNDDVVFQNDDAFTKARSEITLNPAGTQLNSLVLAARGAPGSAARVRIIAIRVAPPAGT